MKPENLFNGQGASLEEILAGRSRRVQRQQEMLSRGGLSLVSFTLNIPGPIKQFSLARAALFAGQKELLALFQGAILEDAYHTDPSGDQVLLRLNLPPRSAKERCVQLEQMHPLGRLFDLDVLGPDGLAVSRTQLGLPPRTCLLCNRAAKICARSRSHSLTDLQAYVSQLLDHYFRNSFADQYTACAVRALLYEVSTTPKPGLVDRNNSGAHQDMDFFTFLDSSAALAPWFRSMFCTGWDGSDCSSSELFQLLRFKGRQAEQAMFVATHGVNTHKGLIFSLGLFCGALGAAQAGHPDPVPLEHVLSICCRLGQCALGDFFSCQSEETAGLRCFHSSQITGVRGQAAQGFPLVTKLALPTLRDWISRGLSLNDAGAITLLALIAHTEDTNMIHREGTALAKQCRHEASALLSQITADNATQLLSQLDREYIRKNLSPGGCADLLALSYMCFFIQQLQLR